jgi:hypothetical protein
MTATITRPPRPAADPAELTALRVLWHSLRAASLDPPGAPGIAYDRPVVQTSPATPTLPHGFGTGHAVDRVGLRLTALDRTHPGPARTLRWYRGRDAAADLAAGRTEVILVALARAHAPAETWERWARAVPADCRADRILPTIRAAACVWARARMGEAMAVWGEGGKVAR